VEGKRLIFVLNIIGAYAPSFLLFIWMIIDIRPYHSNVDLVLRENAQAWLKHLHHTTPTLPFRSAGLLQRTNLASGMAPELLHLAYKPSTAQSAAVCVVRFPNVGKKQSN